MNRHLTFRSGNPVLSSKTFSNTNLSDNQMTIEGTVNKTAISLLLLVGTGYFTFDVINPVLLVGCGIGGFVTAIIIFCFKLIFLYIYIFLICVPF